MSDALWGFFGSVIGSLIGGAIAWKVAMEAAKVQVAAAMDVAKEQISATREMERQRHERELALKLLTGIDEFVHVSFRGSKEDRQLAARTVLTTAIALLPADLVRQLDICLARVERYHQVKSSGIAVQGLTNYSEVENFFRQLKHRVCQEKLKVELLSFDQAGHSGPQPA